MWRRLASIRKLSKVESSSTALQRLWDEYRVLVDDRTHNTVPLYQLYSTLLEVFDGLSAASEIIGDALKSYRLLTVVFEEGDTLSEGGEHPGAIASFRVEQATLYIAAGRALNLLEGSLTLGVGAHNVGLGFRSVLAHEIGHLVMPDVESASGGVMAIVFDDHPKEYWQQRISEYAGEDSKECFAEAFAAYTHPDYDVVDNKIPDGVVEMFEAAGIKPAARKADALEKAKKIRPKKSKPVIADDGTEYPAGDVDSMLDVIDDADWVLVSEAVTPELQRQFSDAGYKEVAAMGFQSPNDRGMLEVVDKFAVEWSENHAAELVTQISESTRDMMRGIVTDSLKEGWSKAELSEEISGTFAFGEARADMIAHTELAMAHSYGRVDIAKEAGATKKRWLLSANHDDQEDCDCTDAAEAGWVDMDESFTDDPDYDFPPGHPNCWCDWVSDLIRDAADEEDEEDDDEAGKVAKRHEQHEQHEQGIGGDAAVGGRDSEATPGVANKIPATESASWTRPADGVQHEVRRREPTSDAGVSKVAIDRAAHEAATSPHNDLPQPTEAQTHAGNYAKGHITVGGVDISIENPAGSKRRPEWPTLQSHYGYIKRTLGADGDHVDCFVKVGTDDSYQGPVYVVDQVKPDGAFDEHKVMIGWVSRPMAIEAYLANYTKGWKVGPVTKLTWGEFLAWIEFGNQPTPLGFT